MRPRTGWPGKVFGADRFVPVAVVDLKTDRQPIGRIGGGVFAGAAAIPETTLRRWVNNATRGGGSCWLWWEAVWTPEEPDAEE